MCWQVHFTPRMLITASWQSLGPDLRSHGDVLFIQQFPLDPAILYLGLLYKNTGITFNFINGGTLDERCCWKPATSVCCIHFSAGSTYSSCLMMLIRAASFTDKCVFGRIHHPEWVFLMSHPPACFTLSSTVYTNKWQLLPHVFHLVGMSKIKGGGIVKAKRWVASREKSQWGLLLTESALVCHRLAAAPWKYINYVTLSRNWSVSLTLPKSKSVMSDISSWHTFNVAGL